jgi:hypothetical protein
VLVVRTHHPEPALEIVMKVYIGYYKNWIGPYQIADKIFFWVDSRSIYDDNDPRMNRWDYKLHDKFGDWLADTWLLNFCNWIHEKRGGQKIKVRIDRHDTWSMNNTLAYIVHPMLVQLKNTKQGAPFVDDEDVPEHLRSTSAPPKENEWDTDGNHFKRWDWVLDEMIWTFEQYADPVAEEQFYSGNHDIKLEKDEESGLTKMVSGPNDTFKVDREGMKAWSVRMDNGTRLFGKYYKNLWD